VARLAPTVTSPIARRSRGLGLLALLLALAGCAAASAGGEGGSGGGGQCNDGSWCGDRLDRDQDNLISSSEWGDAFNAADEDGDGQLSQDEFERAGGNWGGGGRGR
jgi:hypothetical protein